MARKMDWSICCNVSNMASRVLVCCFLFCANVVFFVNFAKLNCCIMILFPNAKINIGLFVTRRREDGFHDLETVLCPVGLCDVLEVVPSGTGRGRCEFEATGIAVDCPPERNLVTRAYDLLNEDFDLPSVWARLHKAIPFGAGLGGGSSDAAFMLRGLNRLFGLGLGREELERYAARLGSDCAFFVRDEPVFATGRGEVMTPLRLPLKGWKLAIVKPERGVSTAEAYRGIAPCPAKTDLRLLAETPVEEWGGLVDNDFERTIVPILPEVDEIKRRLSAAGAVCASMSGSGSAVFGIFKGKAPDVAGMFPECFTWVEK